MYKSLKVSISLIMVKISIGLDDFIGVKKFSIAIIKLSILYCRILNKEALLKVLFEIY
jgi:hypothetical protein